MAAIAPYSPSPLVFGGPSTRPHTPGPTTPVHSPHHSVHSSASLRTPLHTLSIHEYRRQQSTPLARIATPSGKTLRRKAATSALNEVEYLQPKSTYRNDSHSPSQPLHLSRSAHQLAPQTYGFGPECVPDQSFRSQSAKPWKQGGSTSSFTTVDSHARARQFGTRKRLPRPLAPTGSDFRPASNVPTRPTQQLRANPPAPLSFLTEESNVSNIQTTSTPSTFSLSCFPQPPHFAARQEPLGEQAVHFVSTAPATPPATPATIHYRGASFDLLNPHASLQFRDIVTPSGDLDSSDLLPYQTLEESLLDFSEMAPKRPLYGDLSAAHAGIVRRAEDSYSSSNLDLPLPPTPAAISPGSSTYTSPLYSPESHFAPSPLAVKKAPNESRFSLRQLTRTLTKKITKSPGNRDEEELQLFSTRGTDDFALSVDEGLLRPLKQTYVPAERNPYFPISPVLPDSPISPVSLHDLESLSSDEEGEIEYPRRDSGQDRESQGLSSILPDDPSTQVGRAERSFATAFTSEKGSRPYYDDLTSIYASSSVYTGDERRRSMYQHSLADDRRSNQFLRYSGTDATGLANEYSYSNMIRSSRPASRPLTVESHGNLTAQRDGKTDTISKFIDQYDPHHISSYSLPSHAVENTSSLMEPYMEKDTMGTTGNGPRQAPLVPGLGQFEFDLGRDNEVKDFAQTKRFPKDHMPRLPPRVPAPLAPTFPHDQLPEMPLRSEYSDMISDRSFTSYGDTRNLLQLPQSRTLERSVFAQNLEPSSSYSQPENHALQPSSSYSQEERHASPQTPQEALDQAELMFDSMATDKEPKDGSIPAMWGKRSSLDLLRGKRLTDGSLQTGNGEKADWETIADGSQQGRLSMDSIADYSSSEDSRNSLSISADGSLPSWIQQQYVVGKSNYSHPSPIRKHSHPFRSSRPQLGAHSDPHTVSAIPSSDPPSSPPVPSDMPVSRSFTPPRRAVDEPYVSAPWADPYALSDKETQELLASGPNDDILIENEAYQHPRRVDRRLRSHAFPESSSPRSVYTDDVLERQNSFEKLTVVGPKGNLTGTPRGTGMKDAGSSVADTSSPGAMLNSSARKYRSPSAHDGFYASPFPATGSVTRIRQSGSIVEIQHDRSPSQTTIFPSNYNMEPVQGSSPLTEPDRRRSLRNSTTFQPARRVSRAAVPGQTKLRQMVLAPDARTTVSSQDTNLARFVSLSGSGRPSTSDTATPLHPTHPSLDTFPTIRSGKTILAHQHSPHLLCPEREVKDEDEVRRRKLSWLIFACFCILPPCMFLYRMWGDLIIQSITKGDLGHCTAKSKRTALIAGFLVNIGLVVAILVPIVVAQALKAI